MTFLPFTSNQTDEGFEELQETLFLYAAVTNKHMYREFAHMGELEQTIELKRLADKLAEMSH